MCSILRMTVMSLVVIVAPRSRKLRNKNKAYNHNFSLDTRVGGCKMLMHTSLNVSFNFIMSLLASDLDWG